MSNTQKALELLELPDEAAMFEGQVNTKISRFIVVNEYYDFTKLVSGKPTITKDITTQSRTEKFGLYVFNYLNSLLHSFNHRFVSFDGSEMVLQKDFFVKETTVGPFAGQVYWHGQENAFITEAGIDLIVTPYQNASTNGLPTNYETAPTRSGVVYLQQWAKTKVNGSFVKMGSLKVKNYTRQQIESMLSMNEQEIAYETRTTFVRTAVNPETHVTSIAMDIEQNGEFVKGILYINGEKHTDINESGMITSYGKTWPGFIFDWRLYNDAPPAQTLFGSSVTVRFGAQEDNTIKVIAGSGDGYDNQSRTMIYNADNPNMAKLIAYIELLPAQGKNENAGRVYYPETGVFSEF